MLFLPETVMKSLTTKWILKHMSLKGDDKHSMCAYECGKIFFKYINLADENYSSFVACRYENLRAA